jgi:hypothetical protein
MMITVQEIENAIEHLSDEEIGELKAWLFDRDIARDSDSGLLDELVNEAIFEARAGRAKLL